MIKIFKNQKGFTLIEMLVVIAIISILIGIGINTFTIAQKKARDVRRKADLRNIQTALELYKGDNGIYLASTGEMISPTSGNFGGGVVSPYLSKTPVDPSNKTQPYYNYYTNANGSYTISALLENLQDADIQAGKLPCAPSTGYNYCVSP